ncbi:MAG TPA: hypothetical protein DCL54_11260 [Alphaproteobacteria bacterium]|nr:hypothetical protein [Alphaproteobacteria bacterium]HAJ47144.1 hypothetical protein [Alphaproteobacteria bacterium]
MRNTVIAATAALITSAAAFAMDPMEGTYGNTVLVTDKDKAVTSYWFKADKSVKIKNPKGEDANATWELTDGGKKICLTVVLPAGAKAPEGGVKPQCSEFVGGGKKAGDKWEQMDANNQKIAVEIKAGM